MQATSPPLLDVRGVTLQYKTRQHLVTATYRVDFQVYPGERYILLGDDNGNGITDAGEDTLQMSLALALKKKGAKGMEIVGFSRSKQTVARAN